MTRTTVVMMMMMMMMMTELFRPHYHFRDIWDCGPMLCEKHSGLQPIYLTHRFGLSIKRSKLVILCIGVCVGLQMQHDYVDKDNYHG